MQRAAAQQAPAAHRVVVPVALHRDAAHSAASTSIRQQDNVRIARTWQLKPQQVRLQPLRSTDSAAASTRPEEEKDFDLLSTKVADITKELTEELRGCSIYLIGMMGSGKSTVGKMLANTLKYAFFDTDTVIELAHDKKPVSDIFKEYGQDYFRKCESQILRELSPYKNLVVATGGGAVIKPENWGYMHLGIVCWLNGDVDLLARRVAKDGIEKRPLLYSDGVTEENVMEKTREKLSGLMADRRKFYENADVIVSLEGYEEDVERGAPTAVVMYRLLTQLNKKVQEKKKEREERMNFTIENADELKTMRTIQSPVAEQNDQ